MTGWWIPLLLAVVAAVVGWAALEYRKPAVDVEGEELAAWWEGPEPRGMTSERTEVTE